MDIWILNVTINLLMVNSHFFNKALFSPAKMLISGKKFYTAFFLHIRRGGMIVVDPYTSLVVYIM